MESLLSFVDILTRQLGNCVTAGRLKAFLVLLVLTSVTVPLASLPVLPVLRTHVIAALAASHADPWATDIWWSRPYSWILCGGPPGRWIVGTLLGLRVLRERRIPERSWLSGSLVAQPHARLVILVGAAAFIWLFAVVRIGRKFSSHNPEPNASPFVVHDSCCCRRCDQRPEHSGQCAHPPRVPSGTDRPDRHQPLRLHSLLGDAGVFCKLFRCPWYSCCARE